MQHPRLLRVVITTPLNLFGLDLRELAAVNVQQRLRLDVPHQIVVQPVPSFIDLHDSFTSVTFQYSNGYADGADYNDGPGDIEGEIVALIKRILRLETVIVSTEKFDGRRR